MATTDLERLVILIEANTANIDNKLRALKSSVDGSMGSIERRTDAMTRRLTQAFSVTAVIGFARSLLTAADALQDTSQQLGITTADFQGLLSAARDTGAGTDRMKQALSSLTDRLGDAAKGEGDLAKVMRELNIPLGTTMQVLFDIADATQKAGTQNEKMAIATTAFGKAGRELVPILEGGAAGLRKHLEEAQKKGQIWDEGTIKKLGDANDAFERLKVSLTGQLADPFSKVISGISRFVDMASEGYAILAKIYALGGSSGKPFTGPFLAPESFQPNLNRTAVPLSPAQTSAAKSAAEKLAQQQREIDSVNSAGEVERRQKIWKERNDALDDAANFDLQAEIKRQEAEADALKEIQEKILDSERDAERRRLDHIERLNERIVSDFAQTAADVIVESKNIGDAFSGLMRSVAKTLLQETFTDALSGVTVKGIGSFIGSLLGPGRDSGGPVYPGTVYPVGERGMEFFEPSVPGRIYPNGSGSGGGSMVFNIDARGAQQGVAEQIRAMLPVAVAQAVKKSRSEFVRNYDLAIRDSR